MRLNRILIVALILLLLPSLLVKYRAGDQESLASEFWKVAPVSEATKEKFAGLGLTPISEGGRVWFATPDGSCSVFVDRADPQGQFLGANRQTAKSFDRAGYLYQEKIIVDFPELELKIRHVLYVLAKSVGISVRYDAAVAVFENGECHALDAIRAE